jgi:hypothetical protein
MKATLGIFVADQMVASLRHEKARFSIPQTFPQAGGSQSIGTDGAI